MVNPRFLLMCYKQQFYLSTYYNISNWSWWVRGSYSFMSHQKVIYDPLCSVAKYSRIFTVNMRILGPTQWIIQQKWITFFLTSAEYEYSYRDPTEKGIGLLSVSASTVTSSNSNKVICCLNIRACDLQFCISAVKVQIFN